MMDDKSNNSKAENVGSANNFVHHKSCGVLVYRIENKAIEFLLLFQRRSRTWSFSKGHTEFAETEKETALREIYEEIGMKVELVNDFRKEITYRLKSNGTKTVVLFLAKQNGKVIMRQDEIEEYCWANIDKSCELLAHENYCSILQSAQKKILEVEQRN